jgi:Glycosyl transferase family 2
VKVLYTQPEDETPIGISLFTIPKPFQGHIGMIQRNAIASWTQLQPQPEILVFGNEAGTESVSRELGVRHIPQIECNEYGTPRLDRIFAHIQTEASHKIVAYINSDIILMSNFTRSVSTVVSQLDRFLLLGRRWDVEIDQPLDFGFNWQKKLHQIVRETGSLAIHDAKDYFVFPKSLFATIPEFVVGRGYWDTWMVEAALDREYPVVDVSPVVTAIHQNHDYSHVRGGKIEAYMGKEAQQNKAAGNVRLNGTIAQATCQLKPWRFKHSPQVSVVIIAEHQSTSIDRCLESVFNQTDTRFEVIVVDDGADEATLKILQPYLHRIRYIYQGKQGTVAARNRGLKVARGEWVTFLDADRVLLPGALSQQVASFEREASTLDLLLSGWEWVEDDRITRVEPWKNLLDLGDLHVWKLDKAWFSLSQSAAMFRRTQLEWMGGFDSYFESDSASVDAIMRLVFLRGSRALWLPESTYRRLTLPVDSPVVSKFDLETLFDRFFERKEVKTWMRLLPESEGFSVTPH